MSYLHEWHMHRHHFLGPRPLGPSGGAKRSNIIKSELQSQFQRFFKPNFVYLLTNERYITNQTGFSFGRLGHAQGRDLGVPWVGGGGGVGGQNVFSRISSRAWGFAMARHRMCSSFKLNLQILFSKCYHSIKQVIIYIFL